MLRIIREDEFQIPSTRLSSAEELPSIAANRGLEPKKLTGLVRGELDWIVMKALEKDRNRRYETATGLARDIEHYLHDEPVAACPPSAVYRLRKFLRRHRTGAAVAGLILLFLVLVGAGIGWALRDRAAREAEIAHQRDARQAALESGVNAALEDVAAAHRREDWPEALSGLKRAEELLASGEPTPELTARVGQWRNDLETVVRLEEIRLSDSNRALAHWSARPTGHEDYLREFHALGIDVNALPVEEAASRIRSRVIRDQLVAALDDWAVLRGTIVTDKDRAKRPNQSPQWWKRPLAVARAADASEFRNHVRLAVEDDAKASLVELARSPEALRLQPLTLKLLAARLPDAVAIELLTRAQRARPDDFYLNMVLAVLHLSPRNNERKLYGEKPLSRAAPTLTPALPYAMAAVALRPRNGWAWAILTPALELSGQLDEAAAACRETIRLKPDFYGGYINLGLMMHQQRKLEEAKTALQKAIELAPKEAVGYSNLAGVLAAQGRVDEAIAACHKAIECDAKFAAAHSNLGTVLTEGRQFDAAVAAFREALELRPDDPDDYSSLSRPLRLKGDLEAAVAACRKALELDPNHAVAYSNLGAALKDQRKLDEAASAFRRSVELRPDYVAGYCDLALALQERGQLDEAMKITAKAIKMDPDDACAHHTLGVILHAMGKPEEAAAEFRRTIEINPKHADAHANLGIMLKDLGHFDEAIEACNRAIEIQPDSATAYRSLGNVLHAQKKLDDARKAFKKSIELQSNNSAVFTDLGEVLEDQGQLDQAIEAYRRAITLNPGDPSPHNNLGGALYTLGRLKEAVEELRKATEAGPRLAEPYFNLGSVLADLENHKDAVAAFHKSIELKSDDPEPYKLLGKSLARLGNLDDAVAAFRKAIELAQDDPQAYDLLAWMLATWSDPKSRDPATSVKLATRAVGLAPQPEFLATLGVARYRAADWAGAVEAITRSKDFPPGTNAIAWFTLAMSNWQLGNKDEARKWFDQAATWMKNNDPHSELLLRFRTEAEQLPGISNPPPAPRIHRRRLLASRHLNAGHVAALAPTRRTARGQYRRSLLPPSMPTIGRAILAWFAAQASGSMP